MRRLAEQAGQLANSSSPSIADQPQVHPRFICALTCQHPFAEARLELGRVLDY
jgi:hypothetical protein